MLDNRTALEKVNAKERKVNEEHLATFVKGVIRNLLAFVPKLTDQERAELRRAVDSVGGGSMHGLFRPSFSRTLMDLYGKAQLLPIDRKVLGAFIAERNRVIHGRWDSEGASTMETFWWSEYSLNMLELLVLRFFGYEGEFWNRVTESIEYFEHRDPSW